MVLSDILQQINNKSWVRYLIEKFMGESLGAPQKQNTNLPFHSRVSI